MIAAMLADDHGDPQAFGTSADPAEATVTPSLDALDEDLAWLRHNVNALHALLDGFAGGTVDALRGRSAREALARALADAEKHVSDAELLLIGRDELADLREELMGARNQIDLLRALLDSFVRGVTDVLRGNRTRDQMYHALDALDGHLAECAHFRAEGEADPVPTSVLRRIARAKEAQEYLRAILYPVLTGDRDQLSPGEYRRIFVFLDILRDELEALKKWAGK